MAAWRLSPQAPPACVNFKLIGDLLLLSARGVWSVVGLRKGVVGQVAGELCAVVRGVGSGGVWAETVVRQERRRKNW